MHPLPVQVLEAIDFPCGLDPVALLELGLQPSHPGPPSPWPAMSPAEVALMLPGFGISRLIGHGGMGAVYEGHQPELKRRVAVKILFPGLLDAPGQATRFRHEAQLMASLDHPGIVQVFEAGETAEGHLYYVMEFVPGEDLALRMRRGRVEVDAAVGLVCEVARGLQAAHALGIVHRDIKPGNILLPSGGNPKLGDFGLALTSEQAADSLRLTRAGTTLGTLEYAAPEQLSKAQPVSPASDVYSLGVITYELLTGELPRGSFDLPSTKNPLADPAYDAVVLRALQSDPSRRFANASEFGVAMDLAADRHSQQRLREAGMRRKMLRRAWIAVLMSTIALITGGSAILAWKFGKEANLRRMEAEAAEKRTEDLMQFLLTDLQRKLEPTGNLAAMESAIDKAVAYFRHKHALQNYSPQSALQLADVMLVNADVIGVRGLASEADNIYSEVIRLCASVHDSTPTDAVSGLRLVQAWRDRTEHRMSSGRHAEALEDAREMLRQATRLQPQEATQRLAIAKAVANSHKAVANALGYTGPFEAARDAYLEAQRGYGELAAASPQDQSLKDELADLIVSLGSNAEARKDYPEMLRLFGLWHEHVTRRFGPENLMFSHSSFRMGVAMLKTDQPQQAIPYLNDAVRLAQRAVKSAPGHHGQLNHLAWCLRTLANAHEASGNAAQAAECRTQESAINAQLQKAAR